MSGAPHLAIRAAPIALLGLAWPAGAAAQSLPSSAALEQKITATLREIEEQRAQGLSLAQSRERLEEALRRVPQAAATLPAVLRARLRLGQLCLHLFQWERAERAFDAVLAGASPERADLRGAALYGKAISLELANDLRAARDAFTTLVKDHAGTRYGDWAEAGLARLGHEGRALAGNAAPRFAARLDLDGRPRDVQRLAGNPALLVFWSPESRASIDRLVAYRGVWSGQPRDQLLAIAVAADRDSIEKVLRQHELKIPVLACAREFIDPLILDYGVTGVPDAVLLGNDGVILARDPSPALVAEVLAELRGK